MLASTVDIAIQMLKKAAHSNIPTTETCMNCHKQVKTDSKHIKKLTKYYESGKPIEWVKVHMLPDYAYFNHAAHVNVGVFVFNVMVK